MSLQRRFVSAVTRTVLVLPLVSADLPIHCLRTQTAGKWKFHLSDPTEHRTTCGHKAPDTADGQPPLDAFTANMTLSVELVEPDEARIAGTKAVWTMIYDEGMNIQSANLDFFSFNHFQQPKNAMVHGKKYFESFCGKTEVGWYREKKTGKFGCFVGEREESKDADLAFYHLSLLEGEKKRVGAQSGSRQFLKNQAQQTFLSRDQLVSSVDHNRIVSEINSQQSSWVAHKYSDDFIKEKMGQLYQRATRKVGSEAASTKAEGPKAKIVSAALGLEETGKKSASSVALEDDSATLLSAEELPKSWSWDNINGTSWIEPVLDQQDCGSCYAVSSVHMLTSRYRVFKNDPKAEGFSVNFPLYCSDLNQGCNGGYPSLVSMWSRDVGLIPSKCTGKYYTSSTATCKDTLGRHVQRKDFEDCVQKSEEEGKLGAVKFWNYVGGYYGASDAAKMMQDLYKFGPMAVALEPGMDFMYYSKGIYSSAPVKPSSIPWVKVDHAVLCIGWGEEDGKPYWTIQNSWGKGWGENGNIRMVRGENESGVEFQAVSARMTDGSAKKVLAYVFSLLGDAEEMKTTMEEEKKHEFVGQREEEDSSDSKVEEKIIV